MTKADGKTSVVPNSLISRFSKAPSNLSRISKKTPLDAMFKADVMSTKEKNLSKIEEGQENEQARFGRWVMKQDGETRFRSQSVLEPISEATAAKASAL